MAETSSTPTPETWTSPRIIARLVMAFLLAEAIWASLVSLTNNLVLPLLAGAMGGDPASPLYLGKGNINVAGLFSSALELCLAGLVAVVLGFWPQRRVKVVRRTVRVAPAAAPAAVPKAAPPTAQTAPSAPPAAMAVEPTAAAAAKPAAPPAPAQPAKPKPPKEVFYNIVGEPINPTEDD
jgi:predicted lipid-binding transport protein (Tim44 family)